MALDSVIETFLNIQTIIMCVGIYLMTFVIRTVVETYWKGYAVSKFWNHIFLPLGAICNGAIIAMAAKLLPIPTELSGSLAGRAMYGAILGLFSGFMYNRIKAYMTNNAAGGGVNMPGDDRLNKITPEPITPVDAVTKV